MMGRIDMYNGDPHIFISVPLIYIFLFWTLLIDACSAGVSFLHRPHPKLVGMHVAAGEAMEGSKWPLLACNNGGV